MGEGGEGLTLLRQGFHLRQGYGGQDGGQGSGKSFLTKIYKSEMSAKKAGEIQDKRSPIKKGNEYAFPGYPGNKFRIDFVALPGHEENDGGLSGVAVSWLGRRKQSFFYVFKSEKDFWNDLRFFNACDLKFCA